MLSDFLKVEGNHIAINLVTVPWLWRTKSQSGCIKGWITPMVDHSGGRRMAQVQVRECSEPEGPASLSQGPRTCLRNPTDLPGPREVPRRGAQLLNYVRGSCTNSTGQFWVQRAPAQQFWGQRTSHQGQCRLRQQRMSAERGFRTPRRVAEYWGRQRLVIFEFLSRVGGLGHVCSRSRCRNASASAAALTHCSF